MHCVYCGSSIYLRKNDLTREKVYISKNILFVGVDWEREGGPTRAKAFNEVLRVHPDATLTIVGTSPQLGIPNCNVVRRIPLSEVKRYYEEARIFCLSTEIEPFGIVFLEAMAHKLPIIGTIPDFIEEGKNRYMVELGDQVQLSKKLLM